MPRVNLRGVDFYYEVRGRGEPLVLLHNGLGCTKNFSRQMSEFSKHFRVIAYDRYGYGQSAHMPVLRENWLNESVNDLSCLLDQINVVKAHICGVCVGGAIALLFAAQNPQRAGCVAVAGTCCYGEETTDSKVLQLYPPPEKLPASWRTELTRCHGAKHAEELYRIFYRTLLERKGYPFKGYDLRPTLAYVKCPVIVIYGDRDRLFDLSQALTLHKHIDNSELCIIPNCNHLPNEEKPRDFNREVIRFVRRHQTSGLPATKSQGRP